MEMNVLFEKKKTKRNPLELHILRLNCARLKIWLLLSQNILIILNAEQERYRMKTEEKNKQQQKNYIVIKPHTDCKLCALKWRCKNKQKLILSNTLNERFFPFFVFYWIIDLSALFIELDRKICVIQAGTSWSHKIHCKCFLFIFVRNSQVYLYHQLDAIKSMQSPKYPLSKFQNSCRWMSKAFILIEENQFHCI